MQCHPGNAKHYPGSRKTNTVGFRRLSPTYIQLFHENIFKDYFYNNISYFHNFQFCRSKRSTASWRNKSRRYWRLRVIENKDGTNEKFAKENLRKANIALVEKNDDIFQYLLDQKADVMITDDTEAIYQKRSHPQLCIVKFPPKVAPLTGKAIILQKDAVNLQKSYQSMVESNAQIWTITKNIF